MSPGLSTASFPDLQSSESHSSETPFTEVLQGKKLKNCMEADDRYADLLGWTAGVGENRHGEFFGNVVIHTAKNE